MTDPSTHPQREPRGKDLRRLADLVCFAAALASLGMFTVHAVDLATYPWDWDPGEWGTFDSALRLLNGGPALFPRDTVVPIPQTYGPTLAVLLLPVVAWGKNPYFAGRLLMLGIALSITLAAYLLVRRRSSRAVASVCAALVLAPFDQSFWYVLVRVDAVMIALWLWAAVLALPSSLRASGESLSWRRACLAGFLLALAALTKATAVALGAMIIGGWMLVNRRSAVRLAVGTAAAGVFLVLLLQALTGGGFLPTLLLQRHLPYRAEQITSLLAEALHFNWEAMALFVAALAWRLSRRDGRWRDGAWMLWAAGPAMVPFLGKMGAVFNYLLPFFAGQAILLGRLLGEDDAAGATGTRRSALRTALRDLALAAAVAAIALTHPFPSPDAQDRITSQTFFRFVKTRGAPALAAQPECTYGELGQPVEIEHTDFMSYLRAGLPGTAEVVQRVRAQSYRFLVGNQQDMRFDKAPYRSVGFCDLRFYFGLARLSLFVPKDDVSSSAFDVAPGARCLALPGAPGSGASPSSVH
jgi:hypothetical protein